MNKNFVDNTITASGSFDEEKTFWLKNLEGELVKSRFPYNFTGKDVSDYTRDHIEFLITGELYKKITHLSNNSDANLFVFLSAAFTLLLGNYTGMNDIIVGIPILDQQIQGNFLNTLLALRNRLNPKMTFKELLIQVKNSINQANKYSNYPLERILYYLGLPKHRNGFPLFETVIMLEGLHNPSYIEGMNHNLMLAFRREENQIKGTLEYNSALYNKETTQRIGFHFINLMENALLNIDKPVSSIDYLSGAELHRLLVEFNETTAPFPQDMLLHRLFEEQAARFPDHIAVVSQDHESGKPTGMTYSRLNEKSNRLARYLREHNVSRNTIVAIMIQPSIWMTVGILGVLKAGGAYMPIDYESPKDRIEYMLRDSRCRHFLTLDFLMDRISIDGKKIAADDDNIYEGDASNLPAAGSPGDIFYTIYTSGTTGSPKGGLLSHRNMVNYATWFIKTAGITHTDKTILTASFAFDLGYSVFYGSLLGGGQLHLLPKNQYIDPEYLLNYINENHITFLKVTPSFFSVIINSYAFSPETCSSLRLVVLGGEAIIPRDVQTAHKRCSFIKIMNHYGPTETTIGSVSRCIDFDCFEEFIAAPTIGKPIQNTFVYILDTNMNFVPAEVPGELCIGGDGVGLGYLNRPELTAEKFLNKSFYGVQGRFLQKEPLAVLYKTGDLARWMKDGNIEFLGRKDNQVKIRGYRLELGEIENQVLKAPNVRDTVIIARDSEEDGKHLCAYIVPFTPSEPFNIDELKHHIANRLPEYMVPLHFIVLDQLPLTPNGKVDLKALPLPGLKNEGVYIAPRNEFESKMADIWVDVLHVRNKKVGIDSNFFELGGHSLRAAVLASKIHEAFHVNIPIVKIFELQTLKDLSSFIAGSQKDQFVSIPKAEIKEYYELSPAQSRLYVLQQMNPSSTAYNVPLIAELEAEADIEKIKLTFTKLIHRHDSLRTSFKVVKNKPLQSICDDPPFDMEYHEAADEHSYLSLIKHFVRPFNLSEAPLLRVGLIKTPTNRFLLMVDMHHIITDGLSRRLLISEFVLLHSGQPLPPLNLQYKDYSEWMNRPEQESRIKKMEEYWLKEFAGALPVLNIPTDYTRSNNPGFDGKRTGFQLGTGETRLLKDIARENNTTLFVVLLAIYNIFLSKMSGQNDIIVGTSAAGRHHADLEKIIGMFVNTVALRNFPRENITFSNFLLEVKERTMQGFANQEYQFEDLVEKVVKTRDKSRNPLFDVRLTLDNMQDITAQNPSLSQNNVQDINPTAKFDLTLAGKEFADTLYFEFEYRTCLFKEETLLRFKDDFMEILSSVLKNKESYLRDILISKDYVPIESKARQIDLEF